MDQKMNEYEMNGRLMEISLAADCDFLDLVFIKEQIKEKGLTVDSLRELKKIGFPGQIVNFEKAVFDFSETIGIMSSHKIQTLGYKLSRFSRELKEANRN